MKKVFLVAFKKLLHRNHSWQVWSDFVNITACALSNAVDGSQFTVREKSYMDTIKRYEEKERLIFKELFEATVTALDKNPEQDFLGQLFMELELGNHWRGQFFTPYDICRLMAELSNDAKEKVQEKGYISVNDCACGAGATLIAFAHEAARQGINYQRHVLFVGQDIDQVAAQMCYIQLSLLGCAGYVIIANTLTDVNPKPDEHWFTPMYFSKVWAWRRVFQSLDAIGRSQAI